jgi:glycerol-3-phosphate O-acyltransferase/dihydroxyacetone phosphate acyltransferase
MIAEKSWHRPIIGYLSKVMGCIPVVRPQDSVLKGIGQVQTMIEEKPNENACTSTSSTSSSNINNSRKSYILVGKGTQFTSQLSVGDQLRYEGKTVKDSGIPIKVERILDDTHLFLSDGKPLCDDQNQILLNKWVSFGILKKVDQSITFQNVYTHLKRGDCIGIFPEGGSHDRTDLLPLKAGVAIMALGIKDKYNINVPVVPVGLNYFRGHRFRGRVIIEFGSPLFVNEEIINKYQKEKKEKKKEACNEFLILVEEAMRSVLVTAPNYQILQLVYTARRLFTNNSTSSQGRPSVIEIQDLNRRFAEGYKILSIYYQTNKQIQKDLTFLLENLQEYHKILKRMGLKDHQVSFMKYWTFHDVIGSALYGFVIFAFASIPSFVLNAPIGLIARYISLKEQQKALANSKVKIAGRDVLLSKKIIVCMIGVPVLWFFYLFLVIWLTNWYFSSIFLLFLSCPLFSFFGVRSVEAGMIELKTIRPLFYRLLPQKYEKQLGLLVKKKKINWNAFMHQRAMTKKEEDTNNTNSTTINIGMTEKESPCTTTSSTSNISESDNGHITKDHDLSFLRSNFSIDLTNNVQQKETKKSQ